MVVRGFGLTKQLRLLFIAIRKAGARIRIQEGVMKGSLKPGIRHEHKFVVPLSRTVPTLYPEVGSAGYLPFRKFPKGLKID
jgi:hypothetical protein